VPLRRNRPRARAAARLPQSIERPEGSAQHHPTNTALETTDMTDPYTRDDLIAEAARQHKNLTEDPDFVGIGEQMEDATVASHPESLTWLEALGDEGDWTPQMETAQRAIDGLLNGAADTSMWAIALGADGLEPDTDRAVTIKAGERPIARILIAFEPDMPEEQRDDLITGLAAAMAPHFPTDAQGGDDRA